MKKGKAKSELRKAYEAAMEAYTRELCKRYEFRYDREDWISRDIGGLYCAGDIWYFSMDDIIYCVDNDVPFEVWNAWNDYCVELHGYGVEHLPNLDAWCCGCPRRSEEEIERLRKAHKAVEDAENALRQAVAEFKENARWYACCEYSGEELTGEAYIADTFYNDFRKAMNE